MPHPFARFWRRAEGRTLCRPLKGARDLYNSLPSIPRPTTPTSTTSVLVGDPGKALHAGLSCFVPQSGTGALQIRRSRGNGTMSSSSQTRGHVPDTKHSLQVVITSALFLGARNLLFFPSPKKAGPSTRAQSLHHPSERKSGARRGPRLRSLALARDDKSLRWLRSARPKACPERVEGPCPDTKPFARSGIGRCTLVRGLEQTFAVEYRVGGCHG